MNKLHEHGPFLKSLFLMMPFALMTGAARAKDFDGAYVLRLETPFVREQPQWLPLRIELTVQGGKPQAAMATAIHLNQTWYPVDVSALRLAEGRFTGTVSVAFRADDYERAAIAASAQAPKPVDRGKDPYSGKPSQLIALDIPVSGLEQAAPGRATFETDVLNQRQKPVPIAARAWRPPPARGAPVFAEFQLLRWDAVSTRSGVFDGMATGGALLLRCTIRDGQATYGSDGPKRGEWKLNTRINPPPLDGHGEYSVVHRPVLAGVYEYRLEGRRIGDVVAGTVTVKSPDGKEHTCQFLGGVE